MILLDTSGLIAALFPDQRFHGECAKVLLESQERLLLSPFVVAEVDYCIGKFAGIDVQLQFLDELARGVYEIAFFLADEIGAASLLMQRYRDLEIGLADASLVILAERFETNKILTLDHRHFRTVRGPSNRPFRLLPADA